MIDKIKIENLSTGFYLKKKVKKELHKGLNLELKTGEIVCILGPNGAGKSTLLRSVLGFQKTWEGEIFMGDQSLKEIAVREMAKMVSVVLTEKIDDFYLTAYEVVLTGRYPYGSFTGKLTEEDSLLVNKALQQIGIEHLSQQNFIKLSDGEKQKVMIARAVAQNTPFIFLDEPVAFIDSPSKIGIMQLLLKLAKENDKGILLATHDIDSALHYADLIWLLGHNGQWMSGEPKKLVAEKAINKYFDKDDVSFNPENYRFESKKMKN